MNRNQYAMTTVIIYTTPTCTYCRATKEFFKKHNVDFQEIDAAADRKAAQMIVEKTGQLGVPVTIITKDDKEEVVLGFDQPKLAEILGVSL